MRDARNAKIAAQVFVILTVRYFREVDLVAPTVAEQCSMFEVQLMPRYVQYVVVRQVVSGDDTFVALGQVAKLRFELHATIRQQAGCQCYVVIGRNVPVVRHADFISTATGAANLRRQHARFSSVAYRKRQIRRVEYWYSLEAEHYALCGTNTFARIDLYRSALQ